MTATTLADHDRLMFEEAEDRAAFDFGVDGHPNLTDEQRYR